MAKIRYIFLLAVSFLLLFLFFYFKKSQKLIYYSLEGKTYKLLPAKTPLEHQKGLMFYRSKKELKGADGMIFIFSNKNYRTFWNKNTFLDLDVYWIDGDRIVGKDFLPSIEKTKEILIINSPKPVNKVVEIVR
jgi:uncharacterized membrane protein (UPF0127 family)